MRLAIDLPYERVGALKRLLRPGRIELVEASYGEAARVVVAVEPASREEFELALAESGLAARDVS